MSDDALARAETRQTLTATTFVEIVDTLVGDFDVIEVLTVLTSRCVELLDAAAAGILLADSDGHLRVIGASTEQVQLLELFQIQNDEGPCLDCYHAAATSSPTPTSTATRHGRSSPPRACAPGSRRCARCRSGSRRSRWAASTCSWPSPVSLSDTEVALAQALADVASIAIIQDQAIRDAAIREGHLQHALNSRIAIEQAKGMIAERNRVDMDEAFSRLRAYARNNNRGLTGVAEALVTGTLDVDAVGAARRRPPPPSKRQSGRG